MSKKTKVAAIAVSVGLLIPGAAAFAGSAFAASGSAVATQGRVAAQTMYTKESVKVRQTPTAEGRVLYSLKAGTKVSVVAQRTVDVRHRGHDRGWDRGRTEPTNWSQLSDGGWVLSSQLTTAAPKPLNDTSATSRVYVLKPTNLLSGPGTAYTVLRTVPAGQALTVVETGWGWSSDLNATVKWQRVSEGGWIRADQVSTTKPIIDSSASRVFTLKAANVRSGPGTNFNVMRGVPAGTLLTVVETGWGWSSDLNATVKWQRISDGGWIRADLTATY